MLMLQSQASTLLVIDFQARLTPAIDGAAEAIANAQRLVRGADILGIPTLYTEQYPKGLGHMVPELAPPAEALIEKTTFDSTRAPGFLDRLPQDRALVVSGCEAHICVLQTVLGLIEADRDVYVVADAVGSRKAESKRIALSRMEQAGATLVTTEMVLFEWVGDARHPRFKEISALVK
ncbi:MAG TPA: hydrolase [Rhodoblastus sp.]|nr:hydrolase [Rhodoblastus sp.]